jgi:hypothetical protein
VSERKNITPNTSEDANQEKQDFFVLPAAQNSGKNMKNANEN